MSGNEERVRQPFANQDPLADDWDDDVRWGFEKTYGGDCGKLWIVTGVPRSGKSSFAILQAQVALEQAEKTGRKWVVYANCFLKRWNAGQKKWVEVTNFPGFKRVKSFAELVLMIADSIEREECILLIIDEALLSAIGAGSTMQRAETHDVISLVAQSGKLRMSTILIAQSIRMVSRILRSSEGGLLTGVFLKAPLGAGWSAQDIVYMRTPDVDPFVEMSSKPRDEDEFRQIVLEVEPRGIARSELMVRVADGGYDPEAIIFESRSPASMVMGYYPGTRKPFNLAGLLAALSDVLPAEAPRVIREYMYSAGSAEPIAEPASEEEQPPAGPAVSLAQPTHPGPSLKPRRPWKRGQLRQEIIRRLNAGEQKRQVIEGTECSESEYKQVRWQWGRARNAPIEGTR